MTNDPTNPHSGLGADNRADEQSTDQSIDSTVNGAREHAREHAGEHAWTAGSFRAVGPVKGKPGEATCGSVGRQLIDIRVDRSKEVLRTTGIGRLILDVATNSTTISTGTSGAGGNAGNYVDCARSALPGEPDYVGSAYWLFFHWPALVRFVGGAVSAGLSDDDLDTFLFIVEATVDADDPEELSREWMHDNIPDLNARTTAAIQDFVSYAPGPPPGFWPGSQPAKAATPPREGQPKEPGGPVHHVSHQDLPAYWIDVAVGILTAAVTLETRYQTRALEDGQLDALIAAVELLVLCRQHDSLLGLSSQSGHRTQRDGHSDNGDRDGVSGERLLDPVLELGFAYPSLLVLARQHPELAAVLPEVRAED